MAQREPLMKSRAALTLLGSAVLAFALSSIHRYSEISEGGILGLALLLDHHFSVTPALSVLVLSVLCYLLGWQMLGGRFLLLSALATGAFSVFYALFSLLPPFLSGLAAIPPLAAITGGVLVGLGCGLTVRAGGAPTGDDALAMALSSRLGLDLRTVYLLSDLTVLSLSLTYIPAGKILWSLVTVLISGQVVGLLQPPIKKRK